MRGLGMILLASAAALGATAGNGGAWRYGAHHRRGHEPQPGDAATRRELMDGIGARLTNSHSLDRAEDWALAKFRGYGLGNVHREPFEFGRGWNLQPSLARAWSRRAPIDMIVIPVAWTPGTNGAIRAPIVVAPIDKPEHFAAYRGKLAGKIVLVSLPGTSDEPKEAAFKRLTDKDIAEDDDYNLPNYDPDALDRRLKRVQFAKQLDAFLKSEGARRVGPQELSRRQAGHRRGLHLPCRPNAERCPDSSWQPRTIAAWRAWRRPARRR